jgi:hypothetical protein
MRTGSFPGGGGGGKVRPESAAEHSPPSSAGVHGRVELYLNPPSGTHRACNEGYFTLQGMKLLTVISINMFSRPRVRPVSGKFQTITQTWPKETHHTRTKRRTFNCSFGGCISPPLLQLLRCYVVNVKLKVGAKISYDT